LLISNAVRLQKTISEDLVFEGRGLHTGKHVVVRLRPAPRDSGIVFFRPDKGAFINATVNAVSDTIFATSLGSNGTSIKTVEHILAALAGLDIDNIIIEVDGPEIPILDGSSVGFVEMILSAGITVQSSSRPYIKVLRPVMFKEGKTEVSALPYDGRKITYHIHYDHQLLKNQKMSVKIDGDSFIKDLAPARTFGFLKDVEKLRSMGLAKGGSLDNAVILSETGVVNSSGLRFKDEFIRHKMLDFIGDISLVGFPVYGHFVVSRSGHMANIKFLKKFLSSADCWQIVSGAEEARELAACS
jgi:UDP-3-O-[3-hydroxymyristoyl] N-acetylglucosamine deacetylase